MLTDFLAIPVKTREYRGSVYSGNVNGNPTVLILNVITLERTLKILILERLDGLCLS
jgi:hypothetical protein